MKNRLIDLNNHLFAEAERLGDENLTGEALQQEISRARALTGVAGAIIDNADLALRAHIAVREGSTGYAGLPQMLTEGNAPKMIGEGK